MSGDYQVLYAVVTDGVGNLYLVDSDLRPDPNLEGYAWRAPGPDDTAGGAHHTHREIGDAVCEALDDDWQMGM